MQFIKQLEVVIILISIHRLHKETKCGQIRSWSCFECAPLLSFEEYNKHMTTHSTAMSVDNGSLPIKVEIDLIDSLPKDNNEMLIDNSCTEYVEDPISLVQHDDRMHTEECTDDGDTALRKPFECGICGADFVIEHFYKKHISVHGSFIRS